MKCKQGCFRWVGCGGYSVTCYSTTNRTTSSFLILLVFQRVPPPPSAIIGSSSCPQAHLTLCLSATRSIQSRSTSIMSSRLHVVSSSSLLCTSLSRSGQSEPRPFTSAPTPFFPFPLLPFHYFMYFLSVHLAGLWQRNGLLPTLWNKSSVSILADIVAGTHTYTHAHTPWQLYSSLYIAWSSFGSEVQGLFDRLSNGPETLPHPGRLPPLSGTLTYSAQLMDGGRRPDRLKYFTASDPGSSRELKVVRSSAGPLPSTPQELYKMH